MTQSRQAADNLRTAEKAHPRKSAGEPDPILSPLVAGVIIAAVVTVIPADLLCAHFVLGGSSTAARSRP